MKQLKSFFDMLFSVLFISIFNSMEIRQVILSDQKWFKKKFDGDFTIILLKYKMSI